MAGQNIYDDSDFLAGYATLDRQVRGLDGAAEWPVLRTMVPDLADKRVLDLGCGFGWFSRWAMASGASSVDAIDVSTKMLARAQADTSDDRINYRCVDLDELELDPHSFEIVFSSLALHYVHDLGRLLGTVSDALTPGGVLVFSVEHPIYSAPTSQSFESTTAGSRVWPLDNYLLEGERVRTWFVDGVAKQHRTVATHLNAVIGSGLDLTRVEEFGTANPGASEESDDRHRPWFLMLSAEKPA